MLAGSMTRSLILKLFRRCSTTSGLSALAKDGHLCHLVLGLKIQGKSAGRVSTPIGRKSTRRQVYYDSRLNQRGRPSQISEESTRARWRHFVSRLLRGQISPWPCFSDSHRHSEAYDREQETKNGCTRVRP